MLNCFRPGDHSRRTLALLAGLCALACSAAASATIVYADFIAEVQDVSYFNSGILTGAPDDGGAWLSNTPDPPTNLGFITAGFTTGLTDGPGVDIVIYDAIADLPTTSELADVFVSNDGTAFTFLGAYGNSINSFDLAGVFASTVHYVKIVNTSTSNSPDIDAFQGNYEVPEPGSAALLGLASALVLRRRH